MSDVENRTYTVEDIAKILNIGRSSAYNLVKEGHFKIVHIGNAIRISNNRRKNLCVSLYRPQLLRFREQPGWRIIFV